MKPESEEGNLKSEIFNLMLKAIQNDSKCCQKLKDGKANKNNNISKKA